MREDASRNSGVTGRRRAAVPVEVGPARGHPDQPRRAGEGDAYPDGELVGGYDLPLSRHLAFRHNAVPSFSGLKFTAWTRTFGMITKGWVVSSILGDYVNCSFELFDAGDIYEKVMIGCQLELETLVARGAPRRSLL